MSYQKNFNLQRENMILKQNIDFLNKHFLKLNEQFIETKNNENTAIQKLKENNETYLCNICYKEKKNIILLPCFHFNLCDKCLRKIDKCTICREPIECYHYVYS